MFVAGVSFISVFYLPMSGENFSVAIVMSILLGGTLAVTSPLLMSIAMSQPDVHPGNVGVLTGLIITMVGLTRLVIPPIVGRVVENAAPIMGAWSLAALSIISGLILILFVPKQET
jgi:hypothetical protein